MSISKTVGFFSLNDLIFSSFRGVCKAILTCKYLDITNEAFFCAALELINRIISLVDYKGVRDLIQFMVEKVNSLPINANVSILPQLDSMHKVSPLVVITFLHHPVFFS